MDALPPCPDPALQAQLSQTRRRFHRQPERSWTEYQTSARLCAELAALGYELCWGPALYARGEASNPPPAEQEQAAYARAEAALGADHPYLAGQRPHRTGVVASLDGGGPGPVFGFRFDIDALPIQESDAADHPPSAAGFASTSPGLMHACGHDGHLTIGLGLARRLAASRARWRGRVHLLFQPAEEVAGGGVLFAELAQLREVQYLVALHLGIVDRYRLICDARWIASRIFEVEFEGRASHAGNAPQQGRNALLAACHAVLGLYGIARHSDGVTRVNVGPFNAANAHNVIPDRVRLRYEVRGADGALCDYMAAEAQRRLAGAAAMQGVSWRQTPYAAFASAANSPELAARVAEVARELGLPDALLQPAYQVPASEDAGYLVHQVRAQGGAATHLILGCPVAGGHHSSRFDFDEAWLGWGVLLLERLLTRGGARRPGPP